MTKKVPVKKRDRHPNLSLSDSDLVVAFYDAACDHPDEKFAQISKRVAPKGIGKAALRQEARKMFYLARS